VLSLYGVYELARGVVAGGQLEAVGHARQIASLERALHLFVVQRVAGSIPGLVGVLGLAYVSLHLAVSGATLVWLHSRMSHGFAVARTALVVSSFVALAGYLVFPTAPPRLAAVGIVDTVAEVNNLNLAAPLLRSFYNPYAAIPSIHFGYALVLTLVVVPLVRSRLGRGLWLGYPVFVLLVIVATGNHDLHDAVLGGVVGVLGLQIATRLHGTPARLIVRAPETELYAALPAGGVSGA
jgi:hypothetical protein